MYLASQITTEFKPILKTCSFREYIHRITHQTSPILNQNNAPSTMSSPPPHPLIKSPAAPTQPPHTPLFRVLITSRPPRPLEPLPPYRSRSPSPSPPTKPAKKSRLIMYTLFVLTFLAAVLLVALVVNYLKKEGNPDPRARGY